MGLLSSIFKGGKSNGSNMGFNFGFRSNSYVVRSGADAKGGWAFANRFNKAKGGFVGGWAAIAFGNIIEAHSSADEIVDEFELDQPNCPYCDAYEMAYEEEMERAEETMSILDSILGFLFGDLDIEDPEPDMELVRQKAREDALRVAEDWIAGGSWIPSEVLDWAFYTVSDHN